MVGNIANLDTPGYRPVDVSVDAFRAQLGEAIDARRAGGGDLTLRSSEEVRVRADGLDLMPSPTADGILFHDGNDRDLERTMQRLVENFEVFRTASRLLQTQYSMLDAAIAERV